MKNRISFTKCPSPDRLDVCLPASTPPVRPGGGAFFVCPPEENRTLRLRVSLSLRPFGLEMAACNELAIRPCLSHSATASKMLDFPLEARGRPSAIADQAKRWPTSLELLATAGERYSCRAKLSSWGSIQDHPRLKRENLNLLPLATRQPMVNSPRYGPATLSGGQHAR